MAAVPVPTPTQDAILIPRYLKSIDELQVTKVPIPGEPSDFECLIDVAYTNIAFADILLIQGLYQNKPECPFVPGTGFAGVVVKTGKEAGKKFKPGDRVFGYTIASILAYQKSIHHGPWQPRFLHPINFTPPPNLPLHPTEQPIPQLFHVPDKIPLISASCIPSALGTNYVALVERAKLKRGEVIVVLAAAGGLGLTAIQMAKGIGATVIALASSEEKLSICKREAGADYLINYKTNTQWDTTVNNLTLSLGKRWQGADVIYDPVGETTKAMRCLARKGRYLVIGFTSRGAGGVGGSSKEEMPPIPSVQTNRVLLKSNEIMGVNWASYFQYEREGIAEHIPGALEILARTPFVPPVYEEEEKVGKRKGNQSVSEPGVTPYKGLGSLHAAMEKLGSGQTWGLVAMEILGDKAGMGVELSGRL